MPAPGSAAAALLVELTVDLLGFLAGDPVHRLAGTLGRWEETVASAGEAQADLAAVRDTLGARLAGPAPRMQRLLDALAAAEEARFGRGGASGVDALVPFVAARQPLRRPPAGPGRLSIRRPMSSGRPVPAGRFLPTRARSRRGGRAAGARAPRPPLLWGLRETAAAALAAGVAVVAGMFQVVPPPPTALLPNFQRPPAPAGAPPAASGPGTGTPGADRGGATVVASPAGPGATFVGQQAGGPGPSIPAGPSGPSPVQPIVLTAATLPTTSAPSGGAGTAAAPHPVPKGHADARHAPKGQADAGHVTKGQAGAGHAPKSQADAGPGPSHVGHAVVATAPSPAVAHQKVPPTRHHRPGVHPLQG